MLILRVEVGEEITAKYVDKKKKMIEKPSVCNVNKVF